VAVRLWGPGWGTPVVWLRGSLPEQPGIAIVGTRRATAEALAFVSTLVRELAAAGLSVWSGGAIGIDRAAHEAALRAGTPTVVVAPSGLDRPYPAAHAELYGRVLEAGGALLSLWPDPVPPDRPQFLRRNGLLAASTAATVVVQAPCRSGARSTAAAARAFGRPLCVVPQPPWCARGAGCVLELQRGAYPIRRGRDVLSALRAVPAPPGPPRPARPPARAPALGLPAVSAAAAGAHKTPLSFLDRGLSADEQGVLDVLGPTAQHVDQVCERTGRTASAVVRALLTLTLRAVVVEGPAGHYRLERG
jgi:DNA processing protein